MNYNLPPAKRNGLGAGGISFKWFLVLCKFFEEGHRIIFFDGEGMDEGST